MCPSNMQWKISVCAIADASRKADTMVGLFFVPRGSGLTSVAMPILSILRDQAMGGFCFGLAPKTLSMPAKQHKIFGGVNKVCSPY